jgi:hypothetical protein
MFSSWGNSFIKTMRTKRLLSRYIFVVSVFYYLFFVFSISQAQKFVFDFENDADLKDWEIIDESPKNIGKGAPSQWFITNGPIKGKALYQSSNIWGTKDDSCLMGTFINNLLILRWMLMLSRTIMTGWELPGRLRVPNNITVLS